MSASRPLPPARVPRTPAGAPDATTDPASMPADLPVDLATLRRRIAALERRPAALDGTAAGHRLAQP